MIIKVSHLILGVRFFIFMGVMCRTTIRNNREVQPLGIHYPIGNTIQKEGEYYNSNYKTRKY